MFEILLYLNLNCVDASDMISRINANDSVSQSIRTEVIEVIQEASPECNWDAND